MLSIVYVSAATPLCDADQLAAILQESRTKNVRSRITGVLLHSDGNFMQALEGPDDEVVGLVRRISADPRHTRVLTLLKERIVERAFPDWAMAYRGPSKVGSDQAVAYSLADLEKSDMAWDDDKPVSNALHLLASFRRSMR